MSLVIEYLLVRVRDNLFPVFSIFDSNIVGIKNFDTHLFFSLSDFPIVTEKIHYLGTL